MAQRCSPGLAPTIFASQAEEGRPRPARPGDQPGHLRERAVMLAAVVHTMVEYGHTMCDPVPLADQHRSGLGLEDRDWRHGKPIGTPARGFCQPPPSRPIQSAKRGFLKTIRKCSQEKIAAQPG